MFVGQVSGAPLAPRTQWLPAGWNFVAGQGKKREKHSFVALDRVGDEEMLDEQGGMAESNKNPDLIEVVSKELSHVCLVSNNHIINFKGHGQLWGGGFILQVFSRISWG